MSCQNCDQETEILEGNSSPCPEPCNSQNCKEEMDAGCVIYHQQNTTPNQLENIGMENGSSVEEILEKIDDIIGNSFAGDDGTSGTSGTSGTAGTSGETGTSGTSGIDGVAISGTYTPDLANPVNVDTFLAYPSQYIQVGNVATVSGKVTATSSTAGGVSFTLTLPIASLFAFDYELGGTGATADSSGVFAAMLADETNDVAKFVWTATGDLEEHVFYYHFTYSIVESN